MEAMNDTQTANREMLYPMLPAIESIEPLGTLVALNQPGEVNGTSWDGTAGADAYVVLPTAGTAARADWRAGVAVAFAAIVAALAFM